MILPNDLNDLIHEIKSTLSISNKKISNAINVSERTICRAAHGKLISPQNQFKLICFYCYIKSVNAHRCNRIREYSVSNKKSLTLQKESSNQATF